MRTIIDHTSELRERLSCPTSRPPHRDRARLPLSSSVLLVAGCVMLGCGSDTPKASEGTTAILPSMMPAQTTNADAAPPGIPFSAKTPRTLARASASWPHDTAAYTQGLLFQGGRLLESTGREGHSEVREVDRKTGRVIARTALPADAFGEGIAVSGDRVFQLTWKGGRGYSYDVRTLARRDGFAYAGEGWGIATIGGMFYLSDGSSTLRVIDPQGFREVKRVEVREGDTPVWMLNELELVGDELWANIYQTDLIARIVPSTGQIVGWVDLGSLLTAQERGDVTRRGGVANGIAFDASRGILLVTGKLWPRAFELDLREFPTLMKRPSPGKS